MSRYRLMLALCALAIVMLVGCNQPVGLPNNDVHVASIETTYCQVSTIDSGPTGHVDWYSGYSEIDSCSIRYFPLIKRGYYDNDGRPYPRMNGFCVFHVPFFEALNVVPVCSLFYYQSAHNGSADLSVNWLYSITQWLPPDLDSSNDALFWAAWNDTLIIATDSAQSNDSCWHVVSLTPEGCALVRDIAASGLAGGRLITGWTYRGSVNRTYADVCGLPGAHPPYIKVVYDNR